VDFRAAVLHEVGRPLVVERETAGALEPRDEGRLKLDELITQRLPLEQINDGFAGMAKGAVVRAVLTLN
jgi:Zn-dependent alcohol dehydrogenase